MEKMIAKSNSRLFSYVENVQWSKTHQDGIVGF